MNWRISTAFNVLNIGNAFIGYSDYRCFQFLPQSMLWFPGSQCPKCQVSTPNLSKCRERKALHNEERTELEHPGYGKQRLEFELWLWEGTRIPFRCWAMCWSQWMCRWWKRRRDLFSRWLFYIIFRPFRKAKCSFEPKLICFLHSLIPSCCFFFRCRQLKMHKCSPVFIWMTNCWLAIHSFTSLFPLPK